MYIYFSCICRSINDYFLLKNEIFFYPKITFWYCNGRRDVIILIYREMCSFCVLNFNQRMMIFTSFVQIAYSPNINIVKFMNVEQLVKWSIESFHHKIKEVMKSLFVHFWYLFWLNFHKIVERLYFHYSLSVCLCVCLSVYKIPA